MMMDSNNNVGTSTLVSGSNDAKDDDDDDYKRNTTSTATTTKDKDRKPITKMPSTHDTMITWDGKEHHMREPRRLPYEECVKNPEKKAGIVRAVTRLQVEARGAAESPRRLRSLAVRAQGRRGRLAVASGGPEGQLSGAIRPRFIASTASGSRVSFSRRN